MDQYHKALQHIYQNGNDRGDRTNTGSRSIFGAINMEFDLNYCGMPTLPLLSTKSIHVPSIVHELIWMLSGDTNIRYLKENKVKIWDDWVIKGTEEIIDGKLVAGDLGPVYGAMWRKWPDTRIVSDWETEKSNYEARGFKEVGPIAIDFESKGHVIHRSLDQIKILESRLRSNPECRRLILTAWNVSHLDTMALPPCHTLAQWYTEVNERNETVLNCKLYCRSQDFFIGTPFNIVQYSLLTHMLAKVLGYKAGKYYHTVGDAHIYSNHFEQVREILGREIDKNNHPILELNAHEYTSTYKYTSVTQFKAEDIKVVAYSPQPAIKAKIAV